MEQSTSEAIQMMILHSAAAKKNIRECFTLMKNKEFTQVDRKMLDISELLVKTHKLEKNLLNNQMLGDETVEEARLLYASTHFLATTVLFETAIEMNHLYRLGYSC